MVERSGEGRADLNVGAEGHGPKHLERTLGVALGEERERGMMLRRPTPVGEAGILLLDARCVAQHDTGVPCCRRRAPHPAGEAVSNEAGQVAGVIGWAWVRRTVSMEAGGVPKGAQFFSRSRLRPWNRPQSTSARVLSVHEEAGTGDGLGSAQEGQPHRILRQVDPDSAATGAAIHRSATMPMVMARTLASASGRPSGDGYRTEPRGGPGAGGSTSRPRRRRSRRGPRRRCAATPRRQWRRSGRARS